MSSALSQRVERCLALLLQLISVRIPAALERIRIAGPRVRVVAIHADRRGTLLRVLLREQALRRLCGRKVRVAVIEVAIGEGEVHRLVDRVDVICAVVTHRAHVEVLEDVQRLQQRRALRPDVELVDLDAAVTGAERLLDERLPLREVVERDQATLFLHAAHEFLRDVAAIEAVVRGLQGLLARLAGGERLLLSLDHLAQRGGEVGLAEDLTGAWCFARRAEVRQHHLFRVRPFLELFLPALDQIGGLAVDRIAVREFDGRGQHFGERERAVLLQHQDDAARRAGRDCRERAIGGRVLETLALEELGRRTGGRHAEPVDRDHLLRARIVDQGLRFAAPVQHVPHRGGRGDHGAGRVDGIAAALEDLRAGRGAERLAGDRHPVLAVQRRLLGPGERPRDRGRVGLGVGRRR